MGQTALTGRLILGALYVSIAAAILVAAMFAAPAKKHTQIKVFLGGQEISVIVADTPALHKLGLGFRKELNENEGMLFVFAEPGEYGFWMKDMFFSVDIIWFDQNRQIVDVWENAAPSSYPKVLTPRASAQFVLEVPAGFFANYNLKIGNTIEIL